jgi:hypothetical protein
MPDNRQNDFTSETQNRTLELERTNFEQRVESSQKWFWDREKFSVKNTTCHLPYLSVHGFTYCNSRPLSTSFLPQICDAYLCSGTLDKVRKISKSQIENTKNKILLSTVCHHIRLMKSTCVCCTMLSFLKWVLLEVRDSDWSSCSSNARPFSFSFRLLFHLAIFTLLCKIISLLPLRIIFWRFWQNWF